MNTSVKKALMIGGGLIFGLPVAFCVLVFGLATSFIWIPCVISLGVFTLLVLHTRLGTWLAPVFYYMLRPFITGKYASNSWRFIYNHLTSIVLPDDMSVINYGYAAISEDGKYLDKYKENP